jgi:hypothetical protein
LDGDLGSNLEEDNTEGVSVGDGETPACSPSERLPKSFCFVFILITWREIVWVVFPFFHFVFILESVEVNVFPK